MKKEIIIKMNKFEYDNLSNNLEERIQNINADIGSLCNTIADMEEGQSKEYAKKCLTSLSNNIKQLRENYIIYEG